MVGLGEKSDDIKSTFDDLLNAGCDILTVGQYSQPSKQHLEVSKYYSPEEFEELKQIARNAGFRNFQIGPLVRSSYKAAETAENNDGIQV